MSRGREQVFGEAWGAGVLASVLVALCSPSVAGHCRSHVSVTGEASVTGDVNSLFVRLPLRETEHVGRLLYRVTWDENVTPSIAEQGDFVRYLHVDGSVAREWLVFLKRSLFGLPDYPSLKTNISASVVFPAFSDGDECLVLLSHLLQDENTQEPAAEASSWFLQVAKDFPVSTPLQGLTVTVTDKDAATPNNQMEVEVGGACPLETEARQYGGVAGKGHLVPLHLTSPLNDLVNQTFTCTLRVTDMGSPPLSSHVTFSLHVVEEEVPNTVSTTTVTTTTITTTTLPPQLTLPIYLAEVWPGMEVGSPLNTFPAPVKVNGGDTTLSQVTYSLRDAWPWVGGSAYFAINSATGQVWLARGLDGRWAAEGGGSLVPLVIQAQDSSGRVTTAVLQVTIRSPSHSQQSTHDPQLSTQPVSHDPQPSTQPVSHDPQPSTQPVSHDPQPSTQPVSHDLQPSTQPASHDPQLSTQPVSHDPQPSTQPVSHDPQPSTQAVSHDPQPSTQPVSHDPQPSTQPVSHDPQPSTQPVSHDLQPSTQPVSHDPQPSTQPVSHDPQPCTQPVSYYHPASPSYPQPSTQRSSSSDCLCPATRSRGLAKLRFSRLSYAAEVFPTDIFVGRVEARLGGSLGLVRYSWAQGTNVTSFVLNSISGVITVAPLGVPPGSHLLPVRATAGNLTATAQVSVRVLEEKEEEEEEEEEKEAEDEDGSRRLRSNRLRTCDPDDLEGLQVAVGVLAALLGVILIAAGVGGVLLYRRRARARTEVKHISTLGSAYPNLSFSRESQE